VFVRNKRIAAKFALLAVTLAFCFLIVLIGLIGNAIQNNQYMSDRTDADNVQNKLLIAIISIAIFILILCIIFFIMFIRVFFSPSTRQTIIQ
jgi:ABC-type Fe3+ transport system permease subunit